jgi:hypothetical protein
MGSWSESCGFSGLEIGEGEVAYVLLMTDKRGSLNDGAFMNYAPTTTLLRGTYNDYGYLTVEDDDAVLAIFNDQAKLELKQGDDFSIDHLDGRTERRWWIHGSMFDALPSLKPEFPYFSTRLGDYKSEKIKNIGESAAKRIAEIRTAYQAGRAEWVERTATLADHPDRDELLTSMSCLSRFSMRDLFGYSERSGYHERFQDAMIANVEDVEGLLEAYRRTYVLGYALIELRKTLAPNESCGPQWGGEVALDQFAVALRRIIRERKKRHDD